MMKEGRLVSHAPEALREKASVALTKPGRPSRLVLVEGFVALTVRAADIVQLEIGVSRHVDDAWVPL
jgi:hypothetical protein